MFIIIIEGFYTTNKCAKHPNVCDNFLSIQGPTLPSLNQNRLYNIHYSLPWHSIPKLHTELPNKTEQNN